MNKHPSFQLYLYPRYGGLCGSASDAFVEEFSLYEHSDGGRGGSYGCDGKAVEDAVDVLLLASEE